MSDAPPRKPLGWLETSSAILMAISSLGTAWCSFEASRWTGQASRETTQVGTLERKANLLRVEGNQVQAVHVQMFMEYVSARLAGNAALERFYVDRFPAEAKKAFDAWIALKPFENPAAPPHPFVPALYEARHAREIETLLRDSERSAEEARVCSGTSAGYLANTVLLATVLFFVGITVRLYSASLRLGAFCFGVALFAFCAVRMAMLPVAF